MWACHILRKGVEFDQGQLEAYQEPTVQAELRIKTYILITYKSILACMPSAKSLST